MSGAAYIVIELAGEFPYREGAAEMMFWVLHEKCRYTEDVRSIPWAGCAPMNNVQQPLETLAEEPGPLIGLL